MKEVVVLVGTGSIGQAIARRVGAGKHIVLGDLKLEAAQAAKKFLKAQALKLQQSPLTFQTANQF